MTTFEAARHIVRRSERPKWLPDAGTFHIPHWGYQDATHWWVPCGPREWLVDEDEDYCPMDAVILLVDKATGEVARTTYLESMERLNAMTPVGHVPDGPSSADQE